LKSEHYRNSAAQEIDRGYAGEFGTRRSEWPYQGRRRNSQTLGWGGIVPN